MAQNKPAKNGLKPQIVNQLEPIYQTIQPIALKPKKLMKPRKKWGYLIEWKFGKFIIFLRAHDF